MEAPLALYRRYRPETFAEVIGQDHVTAPLRNALSNNRVNHAYLFSGPRGCGKTTSARILARAINCEKGPIAEPCGVCKSCTDLARGGTGSIDVIEIDAASHGGVDDARDLRERAYFAPAESRYKVYIIDEAHMVTTQGFNALLKLVEEPPPHLKFIFATTEPDKVIGTIRSRTHHYPFRLVPPKVLGDYMASLCESEGVAIEPAALPLVVRAGAGSVRDSLSVLDQLIGGAGPDGVTYELAVALLGFTPDSLLDACVDGFAAHDSKAVFETIEKVIETGQDPKRFAEDLLRRLRDLVVLSAVPNAIHSGLIEAAEDQGERLQTQAAGIGPAELTRAADIVAAGLLEMRGATAPRLQLELICAKVLLPGADDSTNGIQARLDRMERRLTIGLPAGTPDAAQPAVAAGDPDVATSRAAARAAAGVGTAPDAAVGRSSAPARAADSAVPAGSGPIDGAQSGDSGRAAEGPAASTAGRSGAWSAESAAPSAAAADSPAPPPAGAAPMAQPATASTTSSTGASAGTGPGSTATGASAAPSAGAVGLADIRRLWPEVLEAVKAKRRFAWIMLSQNAQVIAIDDQTLTLGLVNAGARESFARSGSDEILRQAMIDTIGLNRRIEAVIDPSTDPGAGGGGTHRSGGPHGTPTGSGGAAAGTATGAAGPGSTPGTAGGAGIAGGPGSAAGAADPGSTPGTAGGAGTAGGPGGAAGTPGGPGSGGSGTDGGTAGALSGSGSGGSATHGGAAGAVGGSDGGSAAASSGAVAAGGPGPTHATSAPGGATGAPGGGSAAGSSSAGAAGGPGFPAGATSAPGGAPDAPSGRSRADASGGTTGGGGWDSAGSGSAGGGAGSAGSVSGGVAGAEVGNASPGDAAGGLAAGASAASGSADAGGAGAGGHTGSHAAARRGPVIAIEEPPDYDVPPEPDPWDDPPPPPSRRPSDAVGRQATSADRRDQPAPVDRREQAAPVGRRGQAASKRRAAEAAVAAEQARRVAAAPATSEVPLTPEQEADAIGEDDLVLEEDSRSHTDLLRETLGAQIITEEPN